MTLNNESKSDGFTFRHFHIEQDRCAMKVGIDAVLLGAWCPLPGTGRIKVLDIGAGTGILSLILAERLPDSIITAVEIDEAAAEQAAENVAASMYHERISVVASSVQGLSAPDKSFDLIICNPPFFSGGVMSKQLERSTARHTVKLSHGDLLAAVRRLLAPDGQFTLILPKIEAMRFREIAASINLYPREILTVRPRKEKPVHRILQSFAKGVSDRVVEKELVQYGEGENWNAAFRAVVGAYYL